MNYLLDKKIKRKKFFNIALGVLVLVILFYFRSGIFNGLSFMAGGVFFPGFFFGNNIRVKILKICESFAS